MIAGIITLLIYLCLLALVVYLIFWVLDTIGFSIPAQIKNIIIVICVLIAILLILQHLPIPGLPKFSWHDGVGIGAAPWLKVSSLITFA